MTDKEKLKKLKKLADAMYYAAQYLTTDASRLHKAMDEYHKFTIHECKEEPVSDIEAYQSRWGKSIGFINESTSEEIGDYDHKAVMESLCPQLKEEPTIPDIVDEHFWKMLGEEPVSEELEEAAKQYEEDAVFYAGRNISEFFKAGAQWQNKQMVAKAIDAQCFGFQGAALFSFKLPADKYLVGSKVKVFVIKDD